MTNTDQSMPYTYQPPSGSAARSYIKAGIVIAGGFFLALFLITEDARMASFFMLLFGFGGACLLAGWAIGYKSASRAQQIQSDALAHLGQILQAQAQAMQITAPAAAAAQLPAPRDGLLPVDDSTMVTKAQIQATASKIYHRMYPHTEPTRANIQELFPALKSNGYVTRCMEYLRDMEVVEGGGQGREYRWVVGE